MCERDARAQRPGNRPAGQAGARGSRQREAATACGRPRSQAGLPPRASQCCSVPAGRRLVRVASDQAHIRTVGRGCLAFVHHVSHRRAGRWHLGDSCRP
eukprot:scaffold1564_cov389-Prasinococcus_capsulatus_cf.AAC.14